MNNKFYVYLMGLALTCLLGGSLYGQRTQHLSLELLGSGGLASLNYERQLVDQEALDLHLRFGFSLVPIDRNNGTVLIFPVMVHGLYGKGAHKLDLGMGQALSVTTRGSFFVRAPLSFGYRFAPPARRYYLRAAYTPIVSYLLDLQWEHWGGITFGYRINRK